MTDASSTHQVPHDSVPCHRLNELLSFKAHSPLVCLESNHVTSVSFFVQLVGGELTFFFFRAEPCRTASCMLGDSHCDHQSRRLSRRCYERTARIPLVLEDTARQEAGFFINNSLDSSLPRGGRGGEGGSVTVLSCRHFTHLAHFKRCTKPLLLSIAGCSNIFFCSPHPAPLPPQTHTATGWTGIPSHVPFEMEREACRGTSVFMRFAPERDRD